MGLLGLALVLFKQSRKLLVLRSALSRLRLPPILLKLPRKLRLLRCRAPARCLGLFSPPLGGPEQRLASCIQSVEKYLLGDDLEDVSVVYVGETGRSERWLANVCSRHVWVRGGGWDDGGVAPPERLERVRFHMLVLGATRIC